MRDELLVVIFLRGGADGLNMVVPHGDADYAAARPRLAVGAPGTGGAAGAIDLDGFFGLHPALAPLRELWDAKALAAVHACGSPDPTHSHFDAMDNMERGAPEQKGLATGWLARYLAATRDPGAAPSSPGDPPFRAVGFGALLQGSLRGGGATALTSLEAFRLQARPPDLPRLRAAHGQIYRGPGMLGDAGRLALAAMDTVERITGGGRAPYRPSGGAAYPDTPYGRALMQIAQLAKADVGLEVACADLGDWDTHVAQGGAEGEMAANLAELAGGLRALYADLSDRASRLTVVTMSEFGRRVAENGGGGTDHGHGNVMLVAGGAVRGGRVYGSWPGLRPEQRYGPGDLAVTTDFRAVLAEALAARGGADVLGDIFPGFAPPAPLGLFPRA